MYLDKRKRYVLYAVVAIVSIVALVIVVFEEMSSSNTPITTPTPLIRSSEEEDSGVYKITYSSKNIELISEFNDLFKQKLISDGTDVKPYVYAGEDGRIKDLITSGEGLTNLNWNRATVDLTLPDLHIGNESKEAQEFINFFNTFVNGKMINDAREKIIKDDTIGTYTGTYGAYVRTVKNSTSKEELPIVSYMVKTQMHSSRDGENNEAYSIVYDLKNERKLSLKQMLDIYGIDWRQIKESINRCVNEANANIDENVYRRDNDEMFYSIDQNYNKYVVNEKGDIYIYFCYGIKENTVTNAIDVIKITNNNYNKNSIKNSSSDSIGASDYNRVENVNAVVNENVDNSDNNNELVEDGNAIQDNTVENATVENAQAEQTPTENVPETQGTEENAGTVTT